MRITAVELAQRKKRIIHTAYELFCENGIDAVLMDDIAKQSSVGLNSVFRYFESKAMLVQMTQQYLWEELVEQILSDSRDRLSSAQSGLAEMEILLSNFRGLYQYHSKYLLFSSEYKLYLIRKKIQFSEQDYRETLAPVYHTFVAALERGRADGSIATQNTVDDQFFTIWNVMRSAVEGMAVFDRMYSSSGRWLAQFELTLQGLLDFLRTGPLSSH